MSQASTGAAARPDYNRLGLDYRHPPARRTRGPICDIHAHIHAGPQSLTFFEAARLYGITRVYSMSPVDDLTTLRENFGDAMQFIAVPRWRDFGLTDTFRKRWIEELSHFRELGAPLCKFWMAPPMRQRHGLTVDHAFVRPVVDAARELGFHFMIHVADPSVWWQPGARYAETSVFGTKDDQYPQLEWLCDYVAPRIVIAAHLGGSSEDFGRLDGLLRRHANLHLDSSATKWVVREVSRQPDEARDFLIRNAERVLFGSDLVATPNLLEFDHYASRYWAHQQLWESDYRGESPIADPDADGAPQLNGLALPVETLRAIQWGNAVRLGFASERDEK